MKHSTVAVNETPQFTDTAKAVRGAMAEEQISASDLSRQFGGAVSYWTRRMTGQLPFSDRDLTLIGWATGRHPAEFMGGQPPVGWVAPPSPFREPAATGTQRNRNSSPTPQYVLDWSGSMSNGAQPSFTDADWAEITAYANEGVLA